MIRVLSMVWYKILPAKYGGQKGIASFNQYLAQHLPLACLCSENNSPGTLPYKLIPELPVSKWQFLSPAIRKKLRQTVVAEKATHIIVEHPYHGLAAIKTRKQTGAKLIVHSHNIESERFRKLGKWWWPLLSRYEKWVHREADLSLFKTENDQQWAIDHFGLQPQKCMVAPYGTAPISFTDNASTKKKIQERHSLLPEEKIILFAATLDYQPNAKAVESIYKQIVPRLPAANADFKVIICGRNSKSEFQYLQSLENKNVIMAGEVENIDEYFEAADLFINPVNSGGGVQTKNIDALAHHCSIVCFDGWIDKNIQALAPGKVFTAPGGNWDEFVHQILIASQQRLPTNPLFFKAYSWEEIARRVAERIRLL